METTSLPIGTINAGLALQTNRTSDDLFEFVQGETPFMLTGVWAAGRVKGMEPGFDFKVVPYPVLPDGAVLVINPDIRLSVSAQSTNQELAKQFLAYFMQPENLRQLADNQASFSPLLDEYMPSLSEIHDIVFSYRNQAAVIGADSQIKFPIWNIMDDAVEELLFGKDLTEIMQNMDDRALLVYQ